MLLRLGGSAGEPRDEPGCEPAGEGMPRCGCGICNDPLDTFIGRNGVLFGDGNVGVAIENECVDEAEIGGVADALEGEEA